VADDDLTRRARAALDVTLWPDNSADATTVRGYLRSLLHAIWTQDDEGFHANYPFRDSFQEQEAAGFGKRPFGVSGWKVCDLAGPLAQAGLIHGTVERLEDGYLDLDVGTLDRRGFDRLMRAAIDVLCAAEAAE
jgi:hypothetical protein